MRFSVHLQTQCSFIAYRVKKGVYKALRPTNQTPLTRPVCHSLPVKTPLRSDSLVLGWEYGAMLTRCSYWPCLPYQNSSMPWAGWSPLPLLHGGSWQWALSTEYWKPLPCLSSIPSQTWALVLDWTIWPISEWKDILMITDDTLSALWQVIGHTVFLLSC